MTDAPALVTDDQMRELAAPVEPFWSWSWQGPWLAQFTWRGSRVSVRGWTRYAAWTRGLRVRARLYLADSRSNVAAGPSKEEQ